MRINREIYLQALVEETHVMENIIFNKLKMRGYSVDVGIVEARERNGKGNMLRKQYEVDFVANLGSNRYYLQSAFSVPDEEKKKQEKVSLIKIDDSFKKIILVKAGDEGLPKCYNADRTCKVR